MAHRLDEISHKPISEWKLSVPEIHLASNGYVLRTYDLAHDRHDYTVAKTADEVRVLLNQWAEEVCEGLKRSVERHAAARLAA